MSRGELSVGRELGGLIRARFAALSPDRLWRLLAALAGLTVVQTGLSVWFSATTTQSQAVGIDLVAVLLIGWAFAGTGLFAWWRRPANPVGALMWLTGFFWFFNTCTLSDFVPAFVLGYVAAGVSFAFLIHLMLVFPDGHLETRLERMVVIGGYLVVTLFQLASVPLIDPAKNGCEGCPDNPFLIAGDNTPYEILSAFQSLAGVVVLMGLVVALVRRWRSWSPTQRRIFAPVLWAGGIAMSLLSLMLLAEVAGVPEAVRRGIFFTALIPFTAIPFAFLAGLLRSRISRAEAVGDLVSELAESPEQGGVSGLREALADALSDPELQVVYWVPEAGIHVDPKGTRVELPVAGDGRRVTVVQHDGHRVGAILHADGGEDTEGLVERVASAAGLRMENERLNAELRANLEELRASRARIVEAGYRERRRVERDLHDGAQQRLMALTLNLKLARKRLDDDPEGAARLLDEATKDLEQATAELRELARGIHPGLLTDRGLVPALEALSTRAPVPVELTTDVASRPPAGVEAAAYFLVSEALANVAKHSGAERAAVRVAQDNGSLVVEVTDDGRGGADPEGSGLQGLADRVEALDGRLSVRDREQGGTSVRATIPLS